jgi:hypothetical protein
MKMFLVKPVLLKIALMTFIVVVPFSVSMRASVAQPVTDILILTTLQVKYLGGDNDALFFNIKYDNKKGRDFKLVVLDETGEALFEDKYSKNLDKKLKVPRLTDSEHVIFVIRSVKEKTELSYKVRVTTKVVDDASYVKN